MRVYDLAKELGVNSKLLVITLKKAGIEVKSHMSSLTPDQVKLFKEKTETSAEKVKLTEAVPVEPVPEQPVDDKEVELPDNPTVRAIAELIHQRNNVIIKKLMEKGKMFSLTQLLDQDTARWVIEAFGYTLRRHIKAEPAPVAKISRTAAKPARKKVLENVKEDPRSPVVTIMGHVDHGKTSLLDAIRHTNVCTGEAGGITQHIGAYKVKTDRGEVAFLDTPGHEAFTAMRARGASVTDIVVLVVAADDGVKQQTEEAINHAKVAGVPIIVAINKIDKPDANPDKVKQELANFDLIPEDWGGKTIFAEVSAIKKTGLEHLMEMILLEAEMLELKAPFSGPATGTIVESRLDMGRGPVATVLLQSGSLKVGDAFICGVYSGKVRAMFDETHNKIKVAGPATPVEVLGFSGVPEAGDAFEAMKNEREALTLAEQRQQIQKQEQLSQKTGPAIFSLEDLTKSLEGEDTKELKVIVKADVNGSVEAVADSLAKLSNDEVKVNIIHKAVGAIIEADVMLAVVADAVIIGFNVRPQAKAKKLIEGHPLVRVKLDTVIYNLVDDVEKALKGMASPIYKETVIGLAQVREVFTMPRIGSVAGSFVSEGKIIRSCNIRLLRDDIVVHTGTINSIRRFKDDVKELGSGYECGIKLENFIDYKAGDVIEAYTLEEESRL